MNFNPETVACGYDNSKTIPKRRFRRRVGVCCPVPGARSRRRSTAQPRLARGVQWTEVDRAHRLCLALYATRLAYTREATYQQTRRWLSAGLFEQMVHDLCAYYCGFLRAERLIRGQPYWTRAPCNPRRRAALGEATTERSERRVGSYTQRWIAWETSCSPCM